MARPDDMKLESTYSGLTPDQQELLTEIMFEHPNDIRLVKHKDSDKITIKARLNHWLGYVDFMLKRVADGSSVS